MSIFLCLYGTCDTFKDYLMKVKNNSTYLKYKYFVTISIYQYYLFVPMPTSSVTFLTLLRITCNITQNRRTFVFIKHKHLFYFFKWTIVFALWSCTETVILTFNRLESIEVHYMDTNAGKFSSKTFISFQLKKEIHKHLGLHGGE